MVADYDDYASFVRSISSLIGLPEEVHLTQDIPLKTLLGRGIFNKKQSANIAANVKEATLLYNITPLKSPKTAARSGLAEYSELQILALNLTSHGFYRYQFSYLIWPLFRAIPYPMIIIAYCDDGMEPMVRFSAETCRDNKFDDSLNVVEAIIGTCWIGLHSLNDERGCNMRLLHSFGVSYRNFGNLKDIYEAWASEISAHYSFFHADWALNRQEFTYIKAAIGRYSQTMEHERERWLYPELDRRCGTWGFMIK